MTAPKRHSVRPEDQRYEQAQADPVAEAILLALHQQDANTYHGQSGDKGGLALATAETVRTLLGVPSTPPARHAEPGSPHEEAAGTGRAFEAAMPSTSPSSVRQHASDAPAATHSQPPYANCGRCRGTGIAGGWQGRCPQCGGSSS